MSFQRESLSIQHQYIDTSLRSIPWVWPLALNDQLQAVSTIQTVVSSRQLPTALDPNGYVISATIPPVSYRNVLSETNPSPETIGQTTPSMSEAASTTSPFL